jgi:hypothetical protein
LRRRLTFLGDSKAEMLGTLNDLGGLTTVAAQLPVITFPKAPVKLPR